MNEESRHTLARLYAQLAITEAQVLANPKPIIKRLAEENARLLDLVEKVQQALSPECAFDFWDKECDKKTNPWPIDFHGEALLRCKAAKKLISEFLK